MKPQLKSRGYKYIVPAELLNLTLSIPHFGSYKHFYLIQPSYLKLQFT